MLKSLNDNIETGDNNLNISNEEFKHIIKEGFEMGTLDCYAPLDGIICYRKTIVDNDNWPITMYITENGIAVDHDYACGGNSSHYVWRFTNYKFESAYNAMVEKVLWLQS